MLTGLRLYLQGGALAGGLVFTGGVVRSLQATEKWFWALQFVSGMCFRAELALNLSFHIGTRVFVAGWQANMDFLLINVLQLMACSFVRPTNINTFF